MNERSASIQRQTRETNLEVRLSLDGRGTARVATGIGFLDHLLSTLAFHARLDLELTCTGDLVIDDHHTAEDCALAVGEALDRALGDRSGIARFGWAYVPLDEALSRAVVDLVARPSSEVSLGLRRDSIGGLACENIQHLFKSLAAAGRFTLHVDTLKGENDHHRAESAVKALALALRQAVAIDVPDRVPSTKEAMR